MNSVAQYEVERSNERSSVTVLRGKIFIVKILKREKDARQSRDFNKSQVKSSHYLTIVFIIVVVSVVLRSTREQSENLRVSRLVAVKQVLLDEDGGAGEPGAAALELADDPPGVRLRVVALDRVVVAVPALFPAHHVDAVVYH